MNGQLFISRPAAGCFHQPSSARFAPRSACGTQLIRVFPQRLQQRVEGFGGSFTESAGVVYNNLSETVREQVLQDYFGAQGNRYTLARLPIQSCDFSLGNHACAGSREDMLNGRFDFSRDHEYLMPFIRDALAVRPEMIFMASPWSPPAFMKTNRQMNEGGYLRREDYSLWAELIIEWIKEYRRHGIHISRLSVQNEPVAIKPWESCLYRVEDEMAFAVDYLGKVLASQGMKDIELYIWDHDKDGIADWAERAFADESRSAMITGVAFHWYTGDHFSQIDYLAHRYPDKKLLFSEGCVPMEGGGIEVQQHHGDVYIHDIIGNLKAGACGFIDWNLLLDGEGGPNHQGNRCEAPLQYDTVTGELRRNHSWQSIGHFSRYVLPGARVCLSSTFDALLEEVAFVNPDGERVLVVYNRDAREKSFRVADDAWETTVTLPAHGAATLVWTAARETTNHETRI